MHKIRIITDAASDLCADIPACVTVIPIAIRFGEEEYLDGVNITHRGFYEKLIEGDVLPTTSLISPAVFEDHFRAALEAGEQVIAITVSGELSGTFQSACLAAEEFPGRVHVVDSRSATLGEQILVRYGAQLVEKGMEAEQIVMLLEIQREKLCVLGVLDTLEYLKKGGRISAATALVGGMLAVKPVLTIGEGRVQMLGKARGSRNGNNFLVRQIEGCGGIDFEKPLCLGYTGLSDACLQKYISDSSALYEGREQCLRISTVGATIGTHVGPGAVIVAFFSN